MNRDTLHWMIQTSIVGLSIVVLYAAGCERTSPLTPSNVDEEEMFGTTLALTLVEYAADGIVVDLHYQRSEGQPGPRAVELWLRASPNLHYVDAAPLESILATHKQLIVQPDKETPGLLRVVIFGTQNLDVLDSGPVARFSFQSVDTAPSTLEILHRQPLFAPAEANQGVRLPAPLIIGGP